MLSLSCSIVKMPHCIDTHEIHNVTSIPDVDPAYTRPESLTRKITHYIVYASNYRRGPIGHPIHLSRTNARSFSLAHLSFWSGLVLNAYQVMGLPSPLFGRFPDQCWSCNWGTRYSHLARAKPLSTPQNWQQVGHHSLSLLFLRHLGLSYRSPTE